MCLVSVLMVKARMAVFDYIVGQCTTFSYRGLVFSSLPSLVPVTYVLLGITMVTSLMLCLGLLPRPARVLLVLAVIHLTLAAALYILFLETGYRFLETLVLSTPQLGEVR